MPAQKKNARKKPSSEKQANKKAFASELPAPDDSASTEKWLEFYNKPIQPVNLIEGDDHADKTQEHPQES